MREKRRGEAEDGVFGKGKTEPGAHGPEVVARKEELPRKCC